MRVIVGKRFSIELDYTIDIESKQNGYLIENLSWKLQINLSTISNLQVAAVLVDTMFLSLVRHVHVTTPFSIQVHINALSDSAAGFWTFFMPE